MKKKSFVRMTDDGLVYCDHCKSFLYPNAFGEMPDVCPWCKRDLDWNDFIRITTESTDEQTDKEETK